ncbi:MAG: hypothetical protein AB8H86_32845 [Polyangiales bacterium]
MWKGIPRRPWRELARASNESCESGALVEALVAMMQDMQRIDVGALAAQVRLPANEVAASPFGLRAVALGAATGAKHVHRELTRVPNWDGDERTDDSSHDEWQRGVLQTGKYQAFTQDGAHSIFDPAHIAKWGPHEMMHRACLFFWHEDATSFDLYLGARLNELLPVALWYGADQVARLEGVDFERHAGRYGMEREVARAAWRDAKEDELRKLASRTLHNLRWFARYLDKELAAIDEEIRSGRRVETPWAKGGATLNASSDATAYAIAHAPRLRTPAVTEALGATPAIPSVGEYRAFIETQIEALLFDEIQIGDAPSRDEWHTQLASAVGGQTCEDADGVHGLDLGQLAGGIEESLPHAFEWLEEHGGDWLEDFAESAHLWRRAPLAERLASFCEDTLPAAAAALTRIGGAWLAVKEDPRIRELGCEEGAFLVANAEAIRQDFDVDVLTLLDGGEAGAEKTTVLVAKHQGEVLTLALDQALQSLWSKLEQGRVRYEAAKDAVGDERLASLIHAGVVTRFSSGS